MNKEFDNNDDLKNEESASDDQIGMTSSSLEDLPTDQENKSTHAVILEKMALYYQISKQFLLDSLDLKNIEHKLPSEWREKLPENRRLVTLPIFILLCGFLLILLLAIFAPTATKKASKKFTPVVRVVIAKKEDIHIPVYSQGIVSPKNEIKLVSLVNGPVTYVSPNFVDGGYVTKGELLMAVSDKTYQQDKAHVEANLARAKAAQVARQSELRVRGTLRTDAGKSQLREVNSSVKAAEIDVEKIDDLIAATQIKAPFSGLIRGTSINVGQMISAGTPLASVFSIDKVLVSLPLSDRQLNLVSLPEIRMIAPPQSEITEEDIAKDFPKTNDKVQSENINEPVDVLSNNSEFPFVKIIGDFDGKEYFWNGRLIRSAGGRSELNRLQYVIVEIDKPYGKDTNQPGRPPLSPGFFVEAEIEGRVLKDIIKLPRKALKPNQKIWGVNSENFLQSFDIELIYKGKNFIYVSSGIEDNGVIMVSDLDVLAEGIEVKSVVIQEKISQESQEIEVKKSKNNLKDEQKKIAQEPTETKQASEDSKKQIVDKNADMEPK